MPDTGAVVVAVAQLALTVGELDANRQAGREAVAEAAAAGARLVVLPELSDSGTCSQALTRRDRSRRRRHPP